VTNIILAVTIVLCIYVGFAFASLPSTLSYALEGVLGANEILGLFASMIDFSDILNVNLGGGYWLTLIAITILLTVKVLIEHVIAKKNTN